MLVSPTPGLSHEWQVEALGFSLAMTLCAVACAVAALGLIALAACDQGAAAGGRRSGGVPVAVPSVEEEQEVAYVRMRAKGVM